MLRSSPGRRSGPLFESTWFESGLPVWLAWAGPILGIVAAVGIAGWGMWKHVGFQLRQIGRSEKPGPLPKTRPHVESEPALAPNPDPAQRPVIRSARDLPHYDPPRAIPRGKTPASRLLRKRERREALRRGDNIVPVEISDADAKAVIFGAEVIDRSKSGLCLSVPHQVALNTVLTVRSSQYAECATWVQIRVRNCRQRNDKWLLGCQFVHPQPWGVLLLFG